MPAIFLSYRHSDNADRVNNIRAWLVNHGVPKEEIFLDTDDISIPPRSPFPDKIGMAMQNALCALIVIGPHWLTFRRLGLFRKPAVFERNDWVRKEIEMALLKPRERALTVTLDQTPVPTADQLPASLKRLPDRQAVSLRGGGNKFDEDMLKVARALAGAIAERLRWDEDQSQFIYLPGERAIYLDALIARYGVMDLPIAGGVTLPAGEIYQPLRLRKDPAHPADRSPEERRKRQRDHSDYDTDRDDEQDAEGMRDGQDQPARARADNPAQALALSSTRRMIVLGGPGSGKTTLLHQLALDAARRAQDDPVAPLPLVLSLPALAASGQWTVETLPVFIVSALEGMNRSLFPEKQTPTTIAPLLAHELMRGTAFLCLDGLDEVTPSQRKGVLGWISGLSAPTADAAIIIGSRFTDYREGDLPRGQYTEWELEKLTTETRTDLASALISRLHPALIPHDETSAPLDATQLLKQMGKGSAISWWGDSPLLLTLAAIVFVKRAGSLPQRRVELYEEVVSSLLEDRLRRDDALSPFTLRNTYDLLSAVTLDLFATIGQVFTVKQLTSSTRASCREYNIASEAETERIYLRMINSGMLEPQASGAFKFRHPTFQEYLAGAALANLLISPDIERRERAWALLDEKSVMSRWLEPLALMAGILVTQHGITGQRAAAKWIGSLGTRHASPRGDPGYLALGQALHALRDTLVGTSAELRQTENVCLATWADSLAEAARWERRTLMMRLMRLTPDVADILAFDGGHS